LFAVARRAFSLASRNGVRVAPNARRSVVNQ